jgi:ribosomal protein L3 glutamine methyltransferase
MELKGPLNTQECLERMSAALEKAEVYYGHGTDNAWDEACWLLECIVARQGVRDLHPDTPLTDANLQEIGRLLNERIDTRKPMGYLLNEAWFCHLPFYINEHVLVPRSPTAELIRNNFEPVLPRPPRRILDLCTGSGCIGIACAVAFPDAEVVLSDISPEALEVARINIAKHGLEARVSAVESDLFESLTGTFDLIISNPPYVPEEEYAVLPPEYHREPKLGLVSARNGVDIPLRIVERAAEFLTPEGALILELGITWSELALERPDLPYLWLEFEYGGGGVCLLTREQLLKKS